MHTILSHFDLEIDFWPVSSVVSDYVDISIIACTWQLTELSQVIKM